MAHFSLLVQQCHPGDDFIPAGQIEIGETFQSHDGQLVKLEAIRDTGRVATVYNFRIADFHTYFVGGKEWGFSVWVHNTYNLQSLVDGTRSTLNRNEQLSYVRSLLRQNEGTGNIVTLGFNVPSSYNSTLRQLFQQHLGEQLLELNRLSIFHPSRLLNQISEYDMFDSLGIIDDMRSLARNTTLGPLPKQLYTGQRFAAAHTLDSIAGGNVWSFIGWRDLKVNSSIGRQWRDRAALIVPGDLYRS